MIDDPSNIDLPDAKPSYPRLRLVAFISLAFLVAGLLLILPLISLFTHLSHQLNLAKAGHHILLLESKLSTDPRFINVHFQTFPTNGGSILIQGELPSESDADLLREFIESSNPPLPIIWEISIEPPATETVEPPTTQPNQP